MGGHPAKINKYRNPTHTEPYEKSLTLLSIYNSLFKYYLMIWL
jgi:hypothetical protein